MGSQKETSLEKEITCTFCNKNMGIRLSMQPITNNGDALTKKVLLCVCNESVCPNYGIIQLGNEQML